MPNEPFVHDLQSVLLQQPAKQLLVLDPPPRIDLPAGGDGGLHIEIRFLLLQDLGLAVERVLAGLFSEQIGRLGWAVTAA